MQIIQNTNAVVGSSNGIRLNVFRKRERERDTWTYTAFLCIIILSVFFPNCNFLGLNAGGTETGGVPVPYK